MEEIEKRPKDAYFVVDRSRGDDPVFVLLAGLAAAGGFVVVNIRTGDGFCVLAPPQDALGMFKYLLVATMRVGLFGRVDAEVIQKHLDRIGNWCGRPLLSCLRQGAPVACYQLPDELVGFPSLGVEGLGGGVADKFALQLFSLPPFNKIVPRVLVPDVAVLDEVERGEVPKARPLADFLDDADALLE